MDYNKKIEIIYDKNQKGKGVKDKMVMTNEEREQKVQKYLADHEGVTYSQAVKICLDRTETPGEAIPGEEKEKEEFREEGLTRSEVQMSKQKLEGVIFELSLLRKMDTFGDEDKDKLKEAYETCKVVASNTEPIFSRNL